MGQIICNGNDVSAGVVVLALAGTFACIVVCVLVLVLESANDWRLM